MANSLLALALLAGHSVSAVDTVVVCADGFRPALAPWTQYRAAQGHEVRLVAPSARSADVVARLRRESHGENVRYVVLVGDADPNAPGNVPTCYVPAKVNIHWGRETEIATDSPYGDLDGDDVPDAAVGRLTVDSPEELSLLTRKIMAFEQAQNEGGWRRRVNLVAGVGGFGAVADTLIELTAKRLITANIPAGYATSMTYASWQSPYCPSPRRIRTTALERLNEGCLFWVYIGHGGVRGVDRMRVPGEREYEILQCEDAARMQSLQGAPIAVFLACYTGAFDARQDCLAEEMLRAPGGPVAIAASSRVALPYGLSVMATHMLQSCFADHAPTLGDVVLAAQRGLLTDPRETAEAKLLDALAEQLNSAGTTAADERTETARVVNLIGDPLLRIAHPLSIELDAPAEAAAGAALNVAGQTPLGGRCTLELVVCRDRLKFKPPKRTRYEGGFDQVEAFQEVYRHANDPLLASQVIDVAPGAFSATLQVPADAHGACHVRAYLDGGQQFALGARDVLIHRAKPATTTSVAPP